MTKNDIIRQLAERTGFPVSQATIAVETIIGIIADALVGGNTLFLRGFGAFTTVLRKAKTARDISRQKVLRLPDRKRVKFKTYKQLQTRIDQSDAD